MDAMDTYDIVATTHLQLTSLSFGLFHDTWPQQGHLVSCTTILYAKCNYPVKLQIKWVVSLMIADSHCNLPQGYM